MSPRRIGFDFSGLVHSGNFSQHFGKNVIYVALAKIGCNCGMIASIGYHNFNVIFSNTGKRIAHDNSPHDQPLPRHGKSGAANPDGVSCDTCEKEPIDPVKHPPMAGNKSAGIFNPSVTFQH